jgi:hypothetical protein
MRLRRAEVWARWLATAAELGLHAGDPSDLDLAGFLASGPDWQLVDLDVERVLDRLVALARRRRPLYRTEILADGCLAITFDPDGTVDNLARLLPELRHAARDARQARVLADVGTMPASRVATRWAIAPKTLGRWGQNRSPMSVETPESGGSVADMKATAVPSHAARRSPFMPSAIHGRPDPGLAPTSRPRRCTADPGAVVESGSVAAGAGSVAIHVTTDWS